MALRLGDLLVQNKLISKEQLEMGLQAQRLYGGKLGTNLVELGFIKDTELATLLARQLQMEAAAPAEFDHIAKAALDAVPRDFVEKHKLVPLLLEHKLRVAISDPHDLAAIDELKFKLGKVVQAVVAPEIWIVAALERYYQIRRPLRFVQVQEQDATGKLRITHNLSADISESSEDDLPEGELVETALEVDAEVPFSEFTERLLRAATKEEVFDTLLDYLGPLFPRLAVYVRRKDCYSGWVLRGFPVYAREFAQARITVGSKSVIEDVFNTGRVVRGKLEPTKGNHEAFDVLKVILGREAEVHPIQIKDRTVAVLLGIPDEHHRPPAPEACNLIPLVCRKTGLALEILAIRAQIIQNPTAAIKP